MSNTTSSKNKAASTSRWARAHPEAIRRIARRSYQKHREARALARQNQRAFGASHGPLVACCGQWHPITQVPTTVPCCGAVYFQDLG